MKKSRFLPFLLLFALLAGCAAPAQPEEIASFSLADLPSYAGEPAIELEGAPAFTREELDADSLLVFSPLDELDRRGPATAKVGPETLPTQPRGGIGQIKPPGWHTVRYDFIDGKYLYNRCHLIAYQLTGVNDEPLNLITGTRYLNVAGMLPVENQLAEYIRTTGHHVLYRVTPRYEGEELLCRGVEVEARSVEDDEISLHLFLYNVQPGVVIDYATGESAADPDWEGAAPAESIAPTETSTSAETAQPAESPTAEPEKTPTAVDYVLNTRSKRFHLPDCPGVATMSEKNRQDFVGDREEALALGYAPCGSCKP